MRALFAQLMHGLRWVQMTRIGLNLIAWVGEKINSSLTINLNNRFTKNTDTFIIKSFQLHTASAFHFHIGTTDAGVRTNLKF